MMSTVMTPPNRPASGLTWGKAIKGIALVSAVVVAGVVGFHAVIAGVGLIGSLIGGPGTASSLAALAVEGTFTAGEWAIKGLGAALGAAEAVWDGIPAFFGLTSTLSTTAVAAKASAITTGLSIAGGGAAAAVTAHAVAPHLKATMATPDMASHTDSSAAVLSHMKTSAAMHHDMAHSTADMAKHAGEHANRTGQKLAPGEQPRGWRNIFATHQPTAQNLAPGEQPRGWSTKFSPAQNAASMASAAPRPATPTHAPRDQEFAERLRKDRSALIDALKDGGRA
jgi:hypothetical protein